MIGADRLVWIDLEMTGLNPRTDVILEIASLVTDGELTVLADGPELVINQPIDSMSELDPWVREQHTQSGLFDQVRSSSISLQEAEQQTFDFIHRWCEPGTALLAGNSVWNDRMFLSEYMPRVVNFLHYRLVDVSSFKEMILRWYPENSQHFFEKKDAHRALDDIKESIAELRHYKKYFFV